MRRALVNKICRCPRLQAKRLGRSVQRLEERQPLARTDPQAAEVVKRFKLACQFVYYAARYCNSWTWLSFLGLIQGLLTDWLLRWIGRRWTRNLSVYDSGYGGVCCWFARFPNLRPPEETRLRHFIEFPRKITRFYPQTSSHVDLLEAPQMAARYRDIYERVRWPSVVSTCKEVAGLSEEQRELQRSYYARRKEAVDPLGDCLPQIFRATNMPESEEQAPFAVGGSRDEDWRGACRHVWQPQRGRRKSPR